jgi:hypothetical protein
MKPLLNLEFKGLPDILESFESIHATQPIKQNWHFCNKSITFDENLLQLVILYTRYTWPLRPMNTYN